MATEEQIRECAKRSARILKTPGVWAQGDEACGVAGKYECASTATLRSAMACTIRGSCAGAGALADLVIRRVASLLGLDSLAAVILWNDDPSRTADEVIAVLERVAAGEGAS